MIRPLMNGRRRGGAIREHVLGDDFFTDELTPFLDRTQQTVAATLTRLLATSRPGWTVASFPEITAVGVDCVPEVAVLDDDEGLVVVVEVRTDSSDRYALGVKRLGYEIAGTSEYWFLDPSKRTLSVMSRISEDERLSWPPVVYDHQNSMVPEGPLPEVDIMMLLSANRVERSGSPS